MNSERYIGVFDNEEFFEKAVQTLKDAKIDIEELYMPVPVHHAIKNITGSSRLPVFAYILGWTAVISIFSFLYYTTVISWPLNIGGKPSAAYPSFVIVTLVLTILTVTIISLIVFTIKAKLYPGKPALVFDNRALDDKFLIVLTNQKTPDAGAILRQNGANEIIVKTL